MNRNFPTYQQDEGFRRIAVLLLSLAGLAEHAALRSWPVRCLMLWVLRPAETAARGFATDCGYVKVPLLHADSPDSYSGFSANEHPALRAGDRFGDGLDDATRLAWMFRALAAFFFNLSCEAAHLVCVAGRQVLGCPAAVRLSAARVYVLLAALPPSYADTS